MSGGGVGAAGGRARTEMRALPLAGTVLATAAQMSHPAASGDPRMGSLASGNSSLRSITRMASTSAKVAMVRDGAAETAAAQVAKTRANRSGRSVVVRVARGCGGGCAV